jgi:hypothetical protein
VKKPPTTNKTGAIPDREIVQDDEGRILGSVNVVNQVTGQPMLLPRDLVPYVKNFLIQLQKERKEKTMATTKTERTNMAFISGVIKSIKSRPEEGNGFILVEVGENSKFIPCTIHEDRVLAGKLDMFQGEDFIQVAGYCRAWSQKKDGVWQNNMEVRITRIANEPPRRERKTEKAAATSDDAIPF